MLTRLCWVSTQVWAFAGGVLLLVVALACAVALGLVGVFL